MATLTLPDSLLQQITTLANDRNQSVEALLTDMLAQQNTPKLAWQYTQYETTLTTMTDGLVIHSKDGTILDVNQQFLDIYDIEREEVIGTVNKDYIEWQRYDENGQPIPDVERPVTKTIATEQPITNMVMRVITSTKSIWISVNTQPIYDAQGEFYAVVTTIKDITSFKEKENQLQQQAQLFDVVPDAVITTGKAFKITSWNKGAEAIYGWTAEEAMGKYVFGLIQTEFPDKSALETYADLLDNHVWQGEVIQQSKSGEKLNIASSASIILDVNDELLGSIAINRDITAQKQAEQQLRFQANILDNVSEAIIITDHQFVVTNWNKGAETVYGWTAEEAIGKRVSDLTGNVYLGDTEEHIIQDFITNGVWVGEVIQHTKTGEQLYISSSISAIRNDEGEIIGAVGLNHNVTQQIQAQQDLRQNEQRFRQLVENLTVGVMLQDANAEIITVNQTALFLLGLEEDQVLGKTSFDSSWVVIKEDGSEFPAEEQPVPMAIKTKTTVRNVEMGVYRPTYDDHVWVLVNADPQLDANGDIKEVICTFADITEHHNLAQQLLKIIEQEAQLRQLQSRIISIISHEYRTPLAGILSATELMKRYSDRLTPERHIEYLDRIQSHVHQLNHLVDDVLTVNKTEESGFKFEPDYIDLDKLCQNIVEEARFVDKDTHEITFTSDKTYTDVFVDRNLFQYILNNLLNNAVKYSPPQSVINFDLKQERNTFILIVKDQGIGIPEEDLEHILSSFHRGSNVGNVSGTGLGLAIVKRAVDAHGGKITVESVLDEGTTFTVRIPTSIR